MNLHRTLCLPMLVLLAPGFYASRAQQPRPPSPSSMQYSTDSVEPDRFVAAHGHRAILMGYPEAGLEMWAYPFELLSNYQVRFRPSGSNALKDGRQLLRRVDYRPDSITRTYVGPDFLVRETLFVPLDQAAAVLTYEVEGIRPVDIDVHFTPVLNLMWPGGLGGQYTRWNPGVKDGIPGFVIAGQGNDLAGIIGSREIITHDDTVNTALLTEHGFSFLLHPVHNQATVYMQLNAATEDATAALGKLAASLPQLEQDEAAHYRELDASTLRIRTPDEELNRALAWTKVALDQAWVCNPRLGCGIVAGYGPSRDALRPQYAWYFGGDGLITANALVSAGEYSRARDEFLFIQKYQNKTNGMIWHELSQSAGYIDWSKLPFMFVHVDISFDYLAALARYVTISGDTAFANARWPSIAAAYRYCQSSSGADHLPHIPADKEASDEQHRPADDINLSASWMAAATGYSELAQLTGHSAEAAAAAREAELTRGSIAMHYWNAAASFWYDGHTSTGEPIYREAVGPAQLLGTNVFPAQQENAVLDRLTSADFQADWGTREVAAKAPDYNPYSYGAGSISPISTLAAATGMWQAHRPLSAYAIWNAVTQWTTFDAMGHVHEVMAGNFYHEQTESVPEQTWSSAALLDATVRGLFGLTIDAPRNRWTLAPHLPAAWSKASLTNLRVAKSTLSVTMTQTINSYDLDLRNQGPPTTVLFQPQLPFGASLVSAAFDNRRINATLDQSGADEHARVTLNIPAGESHLHLELSGGVSLSLASQPLHVAEPSTAPKILNVHMRGTILDIEADVQPGHDAIFTLRTPWKLVEHGAATVRPLGQNEYELRIAASSATAGYARTQTSLSFNQE